jgi:hypothetical protein
MIRSGLLLLVAVVSLLGAVALCDACWFDPQPEHAGSQFQAGAADSSGLPLAVRYRQGQPRHWRASLLNQ